MLILAIDPGTTESAYCIYNSETSDIYECSKVYNESLLASCRSKCRVVILPHIDVVAMEMVACYGMAVGETVFSTVLWAGRFIEACGKPFELIYRKEVKLHLCNSMKAKDGNITQALIDRFGEKGTKKNPGKLYGFSHDMWSALAIAVTYAETKITS